MRGFGGGRQGCRGGETPLGDRGGRIDGGFDEQGAHPLSRPLGRTALDLRRPDGRPSRASQIGDLDAELRKHLRLALPQGHEDVFVDRLWAWWYRVVVGLLQGTAATISALEVAQYISDLRDQFTAGNLPTFVDREDFDPSTEGTYSGRAFVEQLRWISFTNTLLQKAIVDYYRAFTQSARWIEDHLVGLNELDSVRGQLEGRMGTSLRVHDSSPREAMRRRIALPAKDKRCSDRSLSSRRFAYVIATTRASSLAASITNWRMMEGSAGTQSSRSGSSSFS